MSTISLQVIQGLERGQYYSQLNVPVTIGREEDNSIQLNDERISRCHLKIQIDQGQVILTDLQSTNGSRVNGLPVQMTVLMPGDLISVGRCILLYGSREEIQKYCSDEFNESLSSESLTGNRNTLSGIESIDPNSPNAEADDAETLGLFDEHGDPAISYPAGCPSLPRSESLVSRAELADLLNYMHARLSQVLESRGLNTPQEDSLKKEAATSAKIPWPHWFKLLDLEADLSRYLKDISEPE